MILAFFFTCRREKLVDKLHKLREYVHSLPVSTDGPEKFEVANFKRLSHCRKNACSVSHNNNYHN